MQALMLNEGGFFCAPDLAGNVHSGATEYNVQGLRRRF